MFLVSVVVASRVTALVVAHEAGWGALPHPHPVIPCHHITELFVWYSVHCTTCWKSYCRIFIISNCYPHYLVLTIKIMEFVVYACIHFSLGSQVILPCGSDATFHLPTNCRKYKKVATTDIYMVVAITQYAHSQNNQQICA